MTQAGVHAGDRASQMVSGLRNKGARVFSAAVGFSRTEDERSSGLWPPRRP